jgi:hypothetical protein
MDQQLTSALERLRFGSIGDLRRLADTNMLMPALAANGNVEDLLQHLSALDLRPATASEAEAGPAIAPTSSHPLPTARREVPGKGNEGPTVIFTYN